MRSSRYRIEPLRLCRLWVLAVGICCTAAQAAGGQEVDLQLRITWGGGQKRAWRGTLFLNHGRLSEVRRLGLEADLPGAMEVGTARIRFWERSASSFDGFDVRVRGDATTLLTLQLATDSPPLRTIDLRLADFLGGSGFVHNSALDDQGNRLLVRRAPGDRLRVKLLNRDTLVFSPGEAFEFQIEPRHLALPPNATVRCTVQLLDRNQEQLWREHFDLQVDGQGETESLPPLKVAMPNQDGVYAVDISLSQRRFANALMRTRLLLQRKIQLVVVDDRPSPEEEAESPANGSWLEVGEIGLSDASWLQRLNLLPQFTRLTGAGRSPLGDVPLERIQHRNTMFLKLGPEKWQAAPIPVAEVGQPHILEVEYPNDIAQTFGITILEPNAAGVVAPLFLDSGIDIPSYPPAETFKTELHRLIFWPRTENPYLLITNRRKTTTAIFGRIRVLAGPSRLPEAATATSLTEARLLAAYLDKPLFPQNFTAAEALESSTTPARSLNDWNTFAQGSRRLVEYLQHVGYNAAILSVARDGSALYPSRLLEPTPRYDNGAFFVSGQDPVPKDVLEMVFRRFDAAGLKLIPAVHFASPLPELERQLHARDRSVGIELVNARGESYVAALGTQRGLAPYYNPLDQRVQQAMQNVIAELVSRYAHHPSFAGVALQLAPGTFAQFPDQHWGRDSHSWARFQQEEAARPPATAAAAAAGEEATENQEEQRWLAWRARVLSDFHRGLANLLTRRRSDAKLFLAMADSLEGWTVKKEMRPRLLAEGSFSEAMMRQGIVAQRYRQAEDIVLLRPRRLSPLISLSQQGSDFEVNRSRSVDDFYRRAADPGMLTFHKPLNLRLDEFDQVSPFGASQTTTWLSAHIPPAGDHNRSRFTRSLTAWDVQTMVEGGWMMPLGQEEAVRELFTTYRRLPAAPFETVPASSAAANASRVTVRSLRVGEQTYGYIVNDSPWSVEVTVDIEAGPKCQLHGLDERETPRLQTIDGQQVWQVPLRPYDLRAAVFSSSPAKITDWNVRFQPTVESSLAALFRDVRARLNELHHPKPLNVLANADFEAPLNEKRIPGWEHPQRPGVTVELDSSRPASGRQSLHLKVDRPGTIGWVRSQSFRLPSTGRISVLASVRSANANQQPPLRIAVDLLSEGQSYDYLYTPLGVDVDGRTMASTAYPAKPLATEWPENPFLFHIRELPVEGPTDVVVGFDLMGEGEVWIDDVQIYDLFFDVNEQGELLRELASAEFQLERGKLAECQQYLEGYWSRFLLEFVPAPPTPRVATLPAARSVSDPPKTPPTQAKEKQAAPSSWNRLVPQLPFRLPFSEKTKKR